ncbi:MAG TPA: glycosyltransferase family 39 protein [Longimicrobiaceae bacterium]|nr:glycosyltransferase family 39 protein [Longimicrobiaceae bacterium]
MIAMSLVAFALLGVLGAAVASLGGLGRARRVEDWPLHFALGASILALLGTAVVIAGIPLALWPVYLLVALAVAGALAVNRRRPGGDASGAGDPAPCVDTATRAILGVAFLVWVAIVAACFQDRLWWDGWQNWVFKARVLFAEGTLSPAFLDPGGAFTPANLDYPLLQPLSDWLAFVHVGAPLSQAASLIGAAWTGVLALLAWSALRDRVDTRVAAAAAVGAAAFWPVAFFAIGGTADVVMAVALMGAAVEMERALRHRETRYVWRTAVFLALGALAKNEGIALAVLGCVAGIGALAATGERRPGRLLPLLLGPLAAAPWFLYTRSLGLASGASGASAVAEHGDRLAMVASALAELFGSLGWMPVPLLAAAAVVSAIRRRDAALGGPWALLALYFAAVCATYVLTAGDVVGLILTSSMRVFGAMVPALVVLAALSVSPAPPVVDERVA